MYSWVRGGQHRNQSEAKSASSKLFQGGRVVSAPYSPSKHSTEKDSKPNDNHRKRRSTSFAGFVSSILPSRRPERGGTLRERGY